MKPKALLDFKEKTIQQIRLWAWLAAVLPITALAGIFFVWRFFDGSILGYVMITGETVMFAVAVVWWWWAMHVIRNLIKHWGDTKEKVSDVLVNVSELRQIVEAVLKPKKK